MPEETTNQKSPYLKRDEVRTMEKDIARLRELESETTREKISQIKTEEEAIREVDRLEQSRQAAEERERMELEAKRKKEELEMIRKNNAADLSAEASQSEAKVEEERESLRAQLKEAQLKEGEARRKFLENVSRQAGEPRSEESEREKPYTPPAPPIPPVAPTAPTPPPPTPTEPKKPFQFPKPKLPSVPIPKVSGYFPGKPSLLEKVWIRVIASLFVIAILAAIGTFWYWYLVIRNKPSAETPVKVVQETVKKELVPAPSLIAVENTENLEIANAAELPNLISQALQKNLGDNKFSRILIKNTSENKFLGLKEFFEAFQVKTPENFYNNVNNDFTLFVFSTPLKNQLGLIAKTENQVLLRSILMSWEQTIEGDTNNLFVLLGKKGTKSPLFQKFTHKSTDVRYLSFTEENFGIVWAVIDDYFIFTSSGESAVKAIDRVGK